MRLIINRFPFLLALLSIGWYGAVVVVFTQNFPYFDDYQVIVGWVERWSMAGADHWALLTEQHNFHRLIWPRLVLLTEVGLTGKIDFSILQYAGNLPVVALVWLFWRHAPGGKNRAWTWAVAVLLLVQTQGWNNMFWAMAGLSNLYASAFALWAFGGLTTPKNGATDRLDGRFWGTMGAGLLATSTNGNGILVLPLLAVGFGFAGQFRRAGATGLLAIIALVWYFQGYQNPTKTPFSTLLTPTNLLHLAQLWTTFLGATVYHPAMGWLAQGLGAGSMAWTVWLVTHRYDRQNPTLFWFLILLQLTGLMLVVNRFEPDVAVMVASRYRNVPALLLATGWLTVADVVLTSKWLKNSSLKIAFGLILLGSIGFNVVSNVTYLTKIRQFRELKQTDQLLWQLGYGVHACAPQEDGAGQLRQLAQAGLFVPDTLILSELGDQQVVERVLPVIIPLTTGLDLNRRVGNYQFISGFAHLDGARANFYTTRIAVRSRAEAGAWRFYTTFFHQRFERQNSVLYRDSGFSALLPLAGLPPDPEFGVLVQAGERTGFSIMDSLVRK